MMMKLIPLWLFVWVFLFQGGNSPEPAQIRINQAGYLPREAKTAILFAHNRVNEKFELINESSGSRVLVVKPRRSSSEGWGTFAYYYELDFSAINQAGTYSLQGKRSGIRSENIRIASSSYDHYQELLLEFMRQQRCGYNPTLDMVCHQRDGRTFYGPIPDSTYVDVSGGWHDAGDMLKYLITGSYATAHMLMAYTLYPDRFLDRCNGLGQAGSNGVPDVLDEARWGLEWILKLHPQEDVLIHQVGDDRDHVGWKMPDTDPADYGWGKNSYRAAYVATGEPQGLKKYKSEATGVSNLAGRSAAAMALAARIWESDLDDQVFADRCLNAAKSLYKLGREKEGFQQGNSYGAPYRYGEETWADDMEWGAAELFKATGDSTYLNDAKSYSRLAGRVSWMPYDTAKHYQYYPFINMGHYSLYEVADDGLKDSLSAYYRSGIEDCKDRAGQNPFGIGVPFIWCSNNLLTSMITQVILYEEMTGDASYHDFLVEQRDWLFGRNPWGTSMFTGIPEKGEYPVEVHTSLWALTKREIPGGLVDGPVYGSIYRSLLGLVLTETDEFAGFQNEYLVYHDDIGDYSTNEPTMDGTAGSILMMAHWASR